MKFRPINNRDLFLDFIAGLKDQGDIKFATNYCLAFHDRFYGFDTHPPIALIDEGNIVSVLFVNFTKNDKYVSIINILTPVEHRGRGYATILISWAVEEGFKNRKCTRIRFNADKDALPFYNKLGCFYLGVTRSGDMYCNMPIHHANLTPLHSILSIDFSIFDTMALAELMDDSSIKLTKRRVSPELSLGPSNVHQLVPERKYRHTEFLSLANETL